MTGPDAARAAVLAALEAAHALALDPHSLDTAARVDAYVALLARACVLADDGATKAPLAALLDDACDRTHRSLVAAVEAAQRALRADGLLATRASDDDADDAEDLARDRLLERQELEAFDDDCDGFADAGDWS